MSIELDGEQSEAIETIAKSLAGIGKELAVVSELAGLQNLEGYWLGALSLGEAITEASEAVSLAGKIAAMIDLTTTPMPKGSE